MTEQWKPICHKGHATNYQVSNLGRVRHRETHHIKSQKANPGGYQFAVLYVPALKRIRLILVAGLVARAFLGLKPQGKQVDHIDGDKTNNAATNLRYVTQAKNIRHSYATTNRQRVGGKKFLSQKTYDAIKEAWGTGKYSQIQLGRVFGLHNSTISKIVNGKFRPCGSNDIKPDWGGQA